MKKLAIVFAMSVSPAFSQQVDPDLSRLKDSYTKAVERATAPITATYTTELKKLMEKHTKSGNLDAALQVKAELQQFIGSSAPQAPEPPKPQRLTRAEEKLIELRIIGKFWTQADGKKDGYLFFKDGKAMRYIGDRATGVDWKIRDDGSVLISGSGDARWLTPHSESEGHMVFGSKASAPVAYKTADPPAPPTKK